MGGSKLFISPFRHKMRLLEAVKESYIFLLGVPGTCIPLIYSLFSYNSHLAVGFLNARNLEFGIRGLLINLCLFQNPMLGFEECLKIK